MKYPQLVSMPSAVSDWLEEELEARGIDSEVYTRYILSLLHTHPLDVIYPEDDLSFLASKKHGGRGVITHKRLRRAGTCWRYAPADAEQIKRSAAVECLMSAAEKNCEIESLVDELCAKLKEVNSDSNISADKTNKDINIFKEPLKSRKISPNELAEKYYAAFPPLNHKEGNSYFSSNINLVTGKWPSSDKNQIDLLAAKWTPGSPKKIKRKPRRQLFETTMKPTTKSNQRHRFGHKRTHCGRNLTKEMADNIANWEFVYNNNNQTQDQCLDFLDCNIANAFSEDVDMGNKDESESPVCRMKVWLQNADSGKDYRASNNNSAVKRTRLYEKKAKYIPLYPTTIWSDNEELANDQWASNLEGDLDRPPFTSPDIDPQAYWSIEESAIREEYQQAKEKEVECAIKEEYDRPHELFCHDDAAHFQDHRDVNCNKTVAQIDKNIYSSNLNMLGQYQMENDVFNFGLITREDLQKQDDEFTRQNYTNNMLEDLNSHRSTTNVICQRCDSVGHWWCRDVFKMPLFIDFDALFDHKTISLMMVNHSMDSSAFREYIRPSMIDDSYFGPFTRPFGRPIKRPHPLLFANKSPALKLPIAPPPRISEEQKRSSPHMYFEPIKPFREKNKQEDEKVLQDGTTFNIRGSPDEVKFQRTTTGSLILETDFGEFKKYFEYNWQSPSDESVKLPRMRMPSEREELTIKYWVSSNDKSCQTMEAPSCISARENLIDKVSVLEGSQSRFIPKATKSVEKQAGGAETSHANVGKETGESEKLDSLDELVWGYAPKSSDIFCKYCNVKHPWPNRSLQDLDYVDWDEGNLKNIWGGSETCAVCPWTSKVPTPLIETTTKLREESKEEAERLLSDLSLQLSYSARLLQGPFANDEGPREKKRRHSYMNNETDLWSFATRLQEDCLVNLSTIPIRRSVTL